jgi:hypothetical protein
VFFYVNLGDADKKNNREILNLLNVLFSPTTPPDDNKKILEDDFNIAIVRQLIFIRLAWHWEILLKLVRKGKIKNFFYYTHWIVIMALAEIIC